MPVPPACLTAAASSATPVTGTITLPGDRDVALGVLACAALAIGTSRLGGIPADPACRALADGLRGFGVDIRPADNDAGLWLVRGRGVGGLAEPAAVLDVGGHAAVASVLTGLAATSPFTTFLTGTATDMGDWAARVVRLGGRMTLRSGRYLPGCMEGAVWPLPLDHSATTDEWLAAGLTLAGLNAPGRTRVAGALVPGFPGLLRHFGAAVDTDGSDPATVSVYGHADLVARDLVVPGDGRIAALAAAIALTRPGSDLVLPGVAIDRLRLGLLPWLERVGVLLRSAPRQVAGQAVADLRVKAQGPVPGFEIDTASLGDGAFPALLLVAASATGLSQISGLSSLPPAARRQLEMLTAALRSRGLSVTLDDACVQVGGTGAPLPIDGPLQEALWTA